MFATQTRDLSPIELTRSGNISSLSAAKAYRVNKVDISTEEKREQEYKEKLLIFLLFFCLYKGLGLARKVFDQTNAMLALSSKLKFSNKNITPYGRAFVHLLFVEYGDDLSTEAVKCGDTDSCKKLERKRPHSAGEKNDKKITYHSRGVLVSEEGDKRSGKTALYQKNSAKAKRKLDYLGIPGGTRVKFYER